MTVHERVAEARKQLRDVGLSPAESELSARLLAEHALGWSTERFLTDARITEPDGFASTYNRLVDRRAGREPLSYIIGQREFWGLSLDVTNDVLIPRPETELIVEAALELHPNPLAPIAAVDVCTGSGCLAVALAHERPRATVIATDISAAALRVAHRNAVRHHVANRVLFALMDMLDGLGGTFDLIVANPPYVRDRDSGGLQPEVRNEPAVALFGGADGLDALMMLVGQAPGRMRPDAHLILEFGFGQDAEVEDLVRSSPALALVEIRRDLNGIARTLVARRV